MRKNIIAAAAVVAGMFCGNAMAQSSEWGLVGSYWNTADAGDAVGVGLKAAFEVVPHARLDFRCTYFDKFSLENGETAADISEVPIEGGLQVYGNAGPVELFAGLGLGYYLTDGDIYLKNNISQSASFDDELGYYFNAGLEIPLTEEVAAYGATAVTLYADIGYRAVELGDVTLSGTTYRSPDIDLAGFTANVGLMMHW